MNTAETQDKIDRALQLLEETSFRTLKAQASALMPRFFDMTEELLCIIDKDQRFVLVSKSWTKELGYSKDELEGNRFMDFVYSEDQPDTEGAFVKYNFEGSQLKRYYFNRYIKKGGGHVWLRWLPEVSKAYEETGFVIGVASVITEPSTIKLLNEHIIENK